MCGGNESESSSWFEMTTGVRKGCFAIAVPIPYGNRLGYEMSDIGKVVRRDRDIHSID